MQASDLLLELPVTDEKCKLEQYLVTTKEERWNEAIYMIRALLFLVRLQAVRVSKGRLPFVSRVVRFFPIERCS